MSATLYNMFSAKISHLNTLAIIIVAVVFCNISFYSFWSVFVFLHLLLNFINYWEFILLTYNSNLLRKLIYAQLAIENHIGKNEHWQVVKLRVLTWLTIWKKWTIRREGESVVGDLWHVNSKFQPIHVPKMTVWASIQSSETYLEIVDLNQSGCSL